MEIVMVICLVVVCLGLLGFILWRDIEQRKQIDTLTSKLICRSLGEFTQSIKAEPKTEAKMVNKPMVDPVMGAAGKNF